LQEILELDVGDDDDDDERTMTAVGSNDGLWELR
jgi:hypothetical protein